MSQQLVFHSDHQPTQHRLHLTNNKQFSLVHWSAHPWDDMYYSSATILTEEGMNIVTDLISLPMSYWTMQEGLFNDKHE